MSFRIVLMEVMIYLEGCYSLKEKRTRLSGLRDRFGKFKNLAVCEADYQDEYERSLWAFVAVGQQTMVDKTLSNVEEQLDDVIDGMVVDVKRQAL
ncbi:MAG: DUF503 family protein [Acidobacteriota bacterium]|nr:DUF503 family protein [Acidobacteriota bacterium]